MLLACDDHWALSRNSRSIFSNSSTNWDFSNESPSADRGKRTGNSLLSEEILAVEVTVLDGCSQEGGATFFVPAEDGCSDSAAGATGVEVDVSSGFLVSIFWAAAANVEIEWFPPALGLRLDDPVRGVREAAMAGSEVLGE